MRKGLILLGLTGVSGLAFGAVPHLEAAAGSATPLPVQSFAGEERLYLTASQAEEAASAGLLPAGVRSILNVRRTMRHGDFIWEEKGVPQGDLIVRVDLERQILSVFRDGHEIGTSVILFGAEGNDTPIGTFPVLTRIRDHRSSTYNNAPMPYTLRLTADGVAIHGSNVRWGAATHGCIGVPTEFARLLFEQAQVGDKVQIVSSAPRT